MNITDILKVHYPHLQWAISGEDYDTLQVHNGDKPSFEELSGKWEATQAELVARQEAATQGTAAQRKLQALTTIFSSLPVETQCAFVSQMAGVKTFSDFGNIVAMRTLIELTPVPQDLEDTKAMMLAVFNG